MNQKLIQPLLTELMKRATYLTGGDSVLVQPAIDGMHVENPVTIPGFDHDQIDAALRWLARGTTSPRAATLSIRLSSEFSLAGSRRPAAG
jgi:ribosomal protein S7